MWALTTGLVVLAVTGAAAVLSTARAGANEAKLNRRVAKVIDAITHETGRYVDTVNTIAAATGAMPELTAAAFRQITDPVVRMNLAGAASLIYVVPIDGSHLRSEQNTWRTRGVTDLVLRPNGASAEHIYAVYSRPLDGRPPLPAGTDVTQSAPATAALVHARETGQITISEPYELIRDSDVAKENRQQSFVLTAPVLGDADAQGTRPLRGWIQMGLRTGDFLAATLDAASGYGVDVVLCTARVDGSWVQVAASQPTIKARPTSTPPRTSHWRDARGVSRSPPPAPH